MLREFGSRHFAAESLRADAMDYGHHRLGSYVLHHHHHHHPCYPNEPGENAFNIAWDHQQPYHHHHHSSASAYHQPALHANPDVAGFFNSVTGGSFLSRPALSHHLRHQHSGHSQLGPANKQTALAPANASGSGPKVKPRRRVASVSQRRAANIRERRRMYSLNTEFDRLRKKVPTFAYEKKLSRIDTLRLAITYISFMKEVLRDGASGPDERALLGPFGGNAGPNSELGPLCNELLWSAKPQIN